MGDEQEVDTQKVKQATRTAVERGENIRSDIRDVTLKALSEGHLDTKKIRQVIRAVLEGASIGAEDKGALVKDALAETMAGMDEALAKSAEASKLAIEETAGRVKDFSSHDLKQAADDLLTLEELFFETVRDVTKDTNAMVKETLSDLVKHAQQSGTSVGKTSSDAVTTLNQKLGNTLKDTVFASTNATLEVSAHIANAAAGVLEGIADKLQSESKKLDKE
ncbi:MAG: hypothetical protein KAT25_06125 [Sulfuriflexus sp.]|nr:hypothetical protein [Sulfuriflexus sp.]